MHLRILVWAWEEILGLIREQSSELAQVVETSCRPIAVDQIRDGVLHVVIGAVPAGAVEALEDRLSAEVVAGAIGRVVSLRVELVIVPWPGAGPTRPGELPAILPARAAEWLRAEAAKCETPLQRLFLVHAAQRRIRLAAEHPLSTIRVDLADVKRRVGIDIHGWFRRREPAHEREHRLLEAGWIGLSFAGEDVYADLDGCLDRLARALRNR